MKVLFVSNLFPDAADPVRGLDNARLCHELAKSCEVRVLALRPTRGLPPLWRPKTFRCRAEDEPLQPVYCPTAYLPKIGSRVNHLLMARTMRQTLAEIRRQFPFDRVLCSWVYPDGCAIARLAGEFQFPFAVIAQGSDVHQYLKMPARRRIIVPAMNRALGVITRSGDLARLLQNAGVAAGKLQAIYNGVDFDVFRPGSQVEARKELNLPLDVPVILYVGNFFPIKNPLLLVAAHAEINRAADRPPCHLVMLGGGPLRDEILRQAGSAAGKTVFLPGKKAPAQVARHMQAANLLCVPSDYEGVPNVILEAFACGLPVVATNVGGIAEVLRHDFLGRLVERRSPEQLVAALTQTLATPATADKISNHARQFSWAQTASAYLQVLNRR